MKSIGQYWQRAGEDGNAGEPSDRFESALDGMFESDWKESMAEVVDALDIIQVGLKSIGQPNPTIEDLVSVYDRVALRYKIRRSFR